MTVCDLTNGRQHDTILTLPTTQDNPMSNFTVRIAIINRHGQIEHHEHTMKAYTTSNCKRRAYHMYSNYPVQSLSIVPTDKK